MAQKKKPQTPKGAAKKPAGKKPVVKTAAKPAPAKKPPAATKPTAKVSVKPVSKPKSTAVAKAPAKAAVKTAVKAAVKAPAKAPAKAAAKKPAPVAKAAPTKASKPAPIKAPAKPAAVPKKAATPSKPAPVVSPKAAKPSPAPAAVAVVQAKVAAPKGAPKKPAKKPAAPLEEVILKPAPRLPPVPMPDGDEEIDHGLALLSGPRNVKPYLAKKGEEYMGTTQLEHFRTILSSWKRDLMVEVDRTVTHMKDEAANPPDPNDRATLESEFSLELRTRDRERKLIRKIDQALERVEDGSYGYCLETGEEIGIKRLEARPVATLSIEAQERRERREKQYGDRDDRYR